MRNRPGSDRVVGYNASSVDDARMAYRIIMPYYAHGSLNAMVKEYQLPANAQSNIPEPFIWSVFEAMTEACLLMENGTTLSTATPPADWHQIVHKDIKLENIWFDTCGPVWPSFPRPVLGDFGMCVLTQENDMMNPSHYADDMGTRGYMAPEQVHFISRKTQEKQLLSRLQGWTNVYGVGRLIQCLMKKTTGADGPKWDKGYEDLGEIFTAAEKLAYSQELRSLAIKCTRYTPRKRITARRLKGKILRRTGGAAAGVGKPDHAGGRRTTAAPSGFLLGWETTDQYALGLTFNPTAG